MTCNDRIELELDGSVRERAPYDLSDQHYSIFRSLVRPSAPSRAIHTGLRTRTVYTLRTHTHTKYYIQPSVMPGLYLFRLSSNDKKEKGEKHCKRSHSPSFTIWAEKYKTKEKSKERVESEQAHFPLPSSRDPEPVIIILSFGIGEKQRKKKVSNFQA